MPPLFSPPRPPGIFLCINQPDFLLLSPLLVILNSGSSSALAPSVVSLCISAPLPLSPLLSLSTYEVYTRLSALCCCSPMNLFCFLPDSVFFHGILFQCTAEPILLLQAVFFFFFFFFLQCDEMQNYNIHISNALSLTLSC